MKQECETCGFAAALSELGIKEVTDEAVKHAKAKLLVGEHVLKQARMEVDEDKITAKSLEAVDRALKDRLSEEEQERHKQELQNMQRSHIEELKRDRESQKAEMQKLNDKIAGLLQGLSETNERAKELSDENNSLKQKLEKVPILGRGQEIELLKQLESVSRHTDDLFESEKVSSLGEDILAKVIEHEQHICDIVIESKHVAQWQNKFIEELRKHMRDRNTQCGILVTSKMPHNALNPHLYITEDGLWVVHIDVAVIAYKALRDLVVRLKQAAASSEQASQIYAEFVQVITSGEYQGKFDAIASTIIRLKGAITKVQNNAVKGCSEALGIAGEIEQGIADIQDTNRELLAKHMSQTLEPDAVAIEEAICMPEKTGRRKK